MLLVIWLVCAACAALCYAIAESKNRDQVVALCMGFLFGIFAVIGYVILPKKEA